MSASAAAKLTASWTIHPANQTEGRPFFAGAQLRQQPQRKQAACGQDEDRWSYRPSLGIPAALDEIRRFRGSRYDPLVVDACLDPLERQGFSLDIGAAHEGGSAG